MRTTKVQGRTSKSFDEVFGNLIAQGMSTDQLHNAVCKQVSSPGCLYAPCQTLLKRGAYSLLAQETFT